MKIAIEHGLYEGSFFSRSLRKLLVDRGHTITNTRDAELIIAHSGGWLMLNSSNLVDKKVALIDPAYRDEKSLHAKSLSRFRYDFRHMRLSAFPGYLFRRLLNIGYLVGRFSRWLIMANHYNNKDLATLIDHPGLIIVRVSDSSWFNPRLMANARDVRLQPGDHDVCWHRPDELADILGL